MASLADLTVSAVRAPRTAEITQRLAVGGVVFHDQDALADDCRDIGVQEGLELAFCLAGFEGEVEAATEAEGAFHPDAPVHHFHEAAGDG